MSIPSARVERLQQALLEHFDRTARDLPWREDRTPYRVWISEIMLQQTRVETVVPYFERWVDAFPSIFALADAPESDVLKLWEGLGYYSRARNAHRAARRVRSDLQGRLPETAQGLRELPGVGEYTSGAIASIAFGERVPAVDGNVRRVLARLFDLADPSPSRLRELAHGLVPAQRPGDWNEALMELGALVCTPRKPTCGACPVAGECRALAAGTVAERPARTARPKVRDARFVSLVARDATGRIFMARRPPSGLLGGLWECPTADFRSDERATARQIAEVHGLELVGIPRALSEVRHTFTHIRATYHPVLVRARGGAEAEDAGWHTPEQLEGLALPVAQRRILAEASAAPEPSPPLP